MGPAGEWSRRFSRWWWRTRWLRRLWRGRLAAITVGVVLALAVTELALRIPGLPLRPDLRNALFQCASAEFDDANIAYFDPKLAMNLPRPHVDRECAWNGYRWHHHGDVYGYRNPESWSQADIVLLGDSTTYGHGVEETSTAAHFLRAELGRTVVNLGWIGDSPVQYLARLQNYALPLHPKVVFVFFFHNDLDDILFYRKAGAIRRFVESGEGQERGIFRRDELAADFHPAEMGLWNRIDEHVLTLRALRFLAEPRVDAPPSTDESSAAVPPLEEEIPLQGAEPLALDYLRTAAQMMAASAKAAGVRLVFSNIPSVDGGRRVPMVRQRVRDAARAVGVPFLDLVEKFAVDGRLERGDLFLPHDGHLTERGHRRVAREVAAFVREQHLLDAP